VAEAYKAAIRAQVNEFWNLTPYETRLHMEIFHDRTKYEQESETVFAWQIAALNRTKKLPKIEKLLKKEPHKRDLAEDLKAAFRTLPSADDGS